MIALSLFFSMTFGGGLRSQQVFNSNESINIARAHIKALNEGILLVRLPSNLKKILELKRLLDEELSENDRRRISKVLDKTIEETQMLQSAIISAMYTKYTFSEYVFFVDSDSREVFKDGSRLFRYYADSSLINNEKKPEEYQLKAELYELKAGRSTYVLTLDQTSDNSLSAYIIKDKELNDLAQPFPSTVIRGNGVPLFFFLINKTTRIKRENENNIKRLDKKLWSFYNSPE